MYLLIESVFLSGKKAEKTKFWALMAKPKAFAGHICPAARMLCMPVYSVDFLVYWQGGNPIKENSSLKSLN